MAYVKKYIGERETGKMLDCIINGVDLGQYPEKEKVYETVWQVDWQPEHMPVGSVVRYFFDHKKENGVMETTVTGHQQNGVKSWVVLTDKPCSILTDRPGRKEAFNASYVTEVVSRGTGTTRFAFGGWGDAYWAWTEYMSQLASLPAGMKRPQDYAGCSPTVIVAYVLSHHPKFKDMGYDGHCYGTLTNMAKALHPIFNVTRVNGWTSHVTVNKKRLVRDLSKLLARSRSPIKILLREEKEMHEAEYRRNMESFLEDI